MNDEQLLAEAVKKLTEENKQLKIELKQARSSLSKANDQISFIGSFRRTFYKYLGVGILLFFVLLVGYPFYMFAKTPRIVSHCIIEASGEIGGYGLDHDFVFDLVGVCPWNKNVIYGRFDSFNDAVAAADRLNCHVVVDTQNYDAMDH